MDNLIVKDNALIEASHKLNEAEQRIILLAIIKAREIGDTVEQLKGRKLTIHASDYAYRFNVDKSTSYRVLKKTIVSLFRAEWGYKFINEKGQSQVAYRRFIQSADYIENGATIQFRFSDEIIPFLVELEKRFTVYDIEQVAQLSSGYAMRLYEFFMQYLDKPTGKGWFDISLEDLRFRFGLLPTEYERMGNFKTRVLDYSINEINNKTDLIATYKQRKKGRVIVGFRFEFTKKQWQQPEKIQETPKTSPKPDLFADLTDEERLAIQARIDEYIQHIEDNGEKVSDFHRTNITKKAIVERWGLDIFDKEQHKKQKDNDRKVLEQVWLDTPNYTRFRHKQDGSTWFKEDGVLRNEDNGRAVPEFQIVNVFQYLEEL